MSNYLTLQVDRLCNYMFIGTLNLTNCYINVNEIPTVRSGTGQSIISTSKGIMTGKDAKSNHLGGELLCLVW